MTTKKNVIKAMLMGILSIIAFTACFDDNKGTFVNGTEMDSEQLPLTAQMFINETFPKAQITSVEFEDGKYEVRLKDYTEIEFYMDGDWSTVDCGLHAVPEHIIPIDITNNVKEQFPEAEITKIDKELYGYEVELSNDLYLKCDHQGMIFEMES